MRKKSDAEPMAMEQKRRVKIILAQPQPNYELIGMYSHIDVYRTVLPVIK